VREFIGAELITRFRTAFSTSPAMRLQVIEWGFEVDWGRSQNRLQEPQDRRARKGEEDSRSPCRNIEKRADDLRTLAAAEKVARYKHAQLSSVRLDISGKMDDVTLDELLITIKQEWAKLSPLIDLEAVRVPQG
jgi:hypothetical protein